MPNAERGRWLELLAVRNPVPCGQGTDAGSSRNGLVPAGLLLFSYRSSEGEVAFTESDGDRLSAPARPTQEKGVGRFRWPISWCVGQNRPKESPVCPRDRGTFCQVWLIAAHSSSPVRREA